MSFWYLSEVWQPFNPNLDPAEEKQKQNGSQLFSLPKTFLSETKVADLCELIEDGKI